MECEDLTGLQGYALMTPNGNVQTVYVRQPAAYWAVVALLSAIILILLWRETPTSSPAWAQAPPLAGARGVYAFTGQIDAGRSGLFMLDVDQGTIWCYALDNVDGTRKLRLIAARTWIYDRYLQDYNCAPPDFRAIQELVAQQRNTAGRRERSEAADNNEDAERPNPPGFDPSGP